MSLMLGRISSDDADAVMAEFTEQILGSTSTSPSTASPAPGTTLDTAVIWWSSASPTPTGGPARKP
jgi:hypothetical protein